MNALDRLRLHIFQDELREYWQDLRQTVSSFTSMQSNKVGISFGQVDEDVEGRVWVEVGRKRFRLRVVHLHPANPSVAAVLQRRKATSNNEESCITKGDMFTQPENDDISLSSLEDYWFNHWQGPHIRADSNQNNYTMSKLRRSHRKSKRKSRCSICHRKLVGVAVNCEEESPCYEMEKNVLAHVPSLIPETCATKEEGDLSDDDVSRLSTGDESQSRCSGNDDQIARVNRILDNELRRSFSLFAGETLSQDVVDTVDDQPDDRFLSPSQGSKLRQSQSCPCSPKLQARASSPATPDSTKSSSYKGMSKFSLSNSLLAIHRQASSSLKSDQSKSDLMKSDSTPCSSNWHNWHRGSIKSETRHLCVSTEETSHGGEEDAEDHSCKNTHFNPKSCKMREISELVPEINNGYSSTEGCSKEESSRLPDVIPELMVTPEEDSADGRSISWTKGGVVNLGFDGQEESSDFSSDHDRQYQSSRKLELDLSLTHAVSIGHMSQGVNYGITIEPSTGVINQEGALPPNASNSSHTCKESNNRRVFPQEDANAFENNQFLRVNQSEHYSEQEYHPTDVMDQARDLVYWWRTKPRHLREEEFCFHEDDCKVKQKPLLVFLHGVGSSAEMWNSQMWYFLACGYEVVAPDLLGHGLSSAPKAEKYYKFSRMLDYVSLVFDLFVPPGRKCIIIGHNYGCALAVALARGRGMAVSMAVLLGCGGPSSLVSSNEACHGSKFSWFVDTFISCGCISREMLYKPRGKHFQPSIGVKQSTPQYILDNMSKGQHWPEGDMAFHRRITIPTLLLYGLRDKNVSLVEMCEMEKTIPRAFLQLIPCGGHDITTDAAEEVCHAIHKFIKRWKCLF